MKSLNQLLTIYCLSGSMIDYLLFEYYFNHIISNYMICYLFIRYLKLLAEFFEFYLNTFYLVNCSLFRSFFIVTYCKILKIPQEGLP